MTSNTIGQNSLVPTARVGFADIVGFGMSGVQILDNGANKTITPGVAFGYNEGWDVNQHVRLLCDMDGNKQADIVGFGDLGVWIAFNNGNNKFTPGKVVLDDFAYYAGDWRAEKHVRFAADIRKVGRCDIIGFGNDGVVVSQNEGGGKFTKSKVVLNEFGFHNGWFLEKHLRFLAPVIENGHQDIVGFGDDSVVVARNKGDGTFASGKKVVNDFCFAQGWGVDDHPRFLADLMGKGSVDIIGCGPDGVHVSMNDGKGNFGKVKKVVDNFGTKQGWQQHHSRFIADLRNTKRGDVIGFWDAGVYVSLNNGDGTFQPAKLVLEDFGTKQGWKDVHPRMVADMTGDGCADIVGFGDKAVFVSISDCKGGFKKKQQITQDFAYNNGKWDPVYTVRYLANLHQGSEKAN